MHTPAVFLKRGGATLAKDFRHLIRSSGTVIGVSACARLKTASSITMEADFKSDIKIDHKKCI